MPTRFESISLKVGKFVVITGIILGILALIYGIYSIGKSQGSGVQVVEKAVEPRDYSSLKAEKTRLEQEKAEAVRKAEELQLKLNQSSRNTTRVEPTPAPATTIDEVAGNSSSSATTSATPPATPAVYVAPKATSLIVAIKNGDTQTALELIQAGKGLNEIDSELRQSPLHWACRENNKEIVEALIGAGVSIDIANPKGQTPLMLASQYADTSILEMLILAGAAANKADNDGATPLCWSAFAGKTENCRLLIDSGANVNHQTEHWQQGMWRMKRQNVLHLAKKSGNQSVINLLIENGAQD